MNFSTDLPKSKPLVTYIVASTMKPTNPASAHSEGPLCFRMHAVVLKDKSTFSMHRIEIQAKLNNGKGFILCHIRQIEPEKVIGMESNEELKSPKEEQQPKVVDPGNAQQVNEQQKLGWKVVPIKDKATPGSCMKSLELIRKIRSVNNGSYVDMLKEIMKDDKDF